jgi:hypothetical protein
MSTRRPNFVIFLSDQHRADLMGCAGHPVLRTPHIDSIAERGVRFDRFYVANPVCMPNRASLMTGRPSSVHGVRSNGLPLPMDEVTFVELPAGAGERAAPSLCLPAGVAYGRAGGAVPDGVRRGEILRSDRAPGDRRPAILSVGVVPRPVPSVHSAGPLLGHVQPRPDARGMGLRGSRVAGAAARASGVR